MNFSLLILLLNLFLVHGRPADDAVTSGTGRTTEDQQIDDECASRMVLGVDHYAKCVAEKGREAEAARQRAAEARRLIELNDGPTSNETVDRSELAEPAVRMVCNPDGAVSACRSASEHAAQMNSYGSSLNATTSSLQTCRAACNPESSQVLRNFLNGCRGDVSSKKQAMLSMMNNCGTSSSSSTASVNRDTENPQGESAWDILTSNNMSVTDRFHALSLRAGVAFEPTGGATNSFATTSGTQLDGGINYLRTTGRDGSVAYQYCAGQNCYDNYDSARAGTASTATAFPGSGGSAAFPQPQNETAPRNAETFARTESGEVVESDATTSRFSFGKNITGTPDADIGLSMGTEAEPEVATVRPRPRQLPDVGAGGDSGEGNNSGSNSDTNVVENDTTQNTDPQVVTPAPNEPVSYQPGNFAGLQSAMNARPGGGGGISSSSSAGGEVRGGGSSISGSYNASSTRAGPLAFEGSGQLSPSAIRSNETPAIRSPAGPSAATMDVASPGGGPRGGAFPDFAGGRMMAAARPGPASLETSMSPSMRSDTYYRTSGGGRAAARTADRAAAPCKGANCRRPPRPTGIAAANCDGNPQCLLALTGKLQLPRRAGAEPVYEVGSEGVRRIRANTGERGIASVQRRTEPGGVVRGKVQDVLNLIGSSDVFKLDHNGMLEVDL